MKILRRFLAVLKHPASRGGSALLILGLLYYGGRLDLSNIYYVPAWGWVCVSLALMFPSFLITALRFRVVLGGVGMASSYFKSLTWTMIGCFWDVAMPSSSGGDLFKIVYLADHFGERRGGLAMLAVILDRVSGLFGLLLFGFLACLFGWHRLAADPRLYQLPWILFGLVALGFVGFLVPLHSRFRESPLRRRVMSWLPRPEKWEEVYQGYSHLGSQFPLLARILALSVLNHVFVVSSILSLAVGLGLSLPALAAMIVVPLALLLNVFGFCGGFGAGEAAFEYLFSVFLSTAPGTGTRLSLAFHVAFVLIRLSGLPFYLFSGRRKTQSDLTAAGVIS